MKSYLFTLSYVVSLLVGTVSAYAATPIQTKTIQLNGDPTYLAVTSDGSEVYVTIESDAVSVINTTSNTVTDTIHLDSSPGRVAITPDGSEAYVVTITDDDKVDVVVINTSAKTFTTINTTLQPSSVANIAITSDGSQVYVVSPSSGTSFTVIDTTSHVPASVDVGKGFLSAILFSPDGTKAYALSVPDDEKGVVCVIDTASNTLTTTIEVGINEQSNIWYTPMAISSDGSRLYVLNSPGDDNTIKGSVSIIDTGSNDVIDTVEVGIEPSAIAAIPNQPKVYAVNYPNPGVCSISVVDTSSSEVTNEVAVGLGSNFIALTPDGSIAYVSNSGSNSVSVIDTNVDAVIYTVQAGDSPGPLVVTPDGATVYVINTDGGSVTTFNTPATSHGSNLGTSFLLRSAQGLTSTEFFANLAWDTSPGAISYKIYRDGVLIATLPAGTTEYRDHNLEPNRTYTYTLDAVTEYGTIHYDFWQDPNP